MSKKLGAWRWYCGSHDGDEEMADCGTREDAIRFGLREGDGQFFIIEARMWESDERAMSDGRADSSPFARCRNGEVIPREMRLLDSALAALKETGDA